MKVLMISGDKNMLISGTEANRRLELQRSQVEQLDIFVWPRTHTLREILKTVRKTHYDVITGQDPFWRGHLAWHLSKINHARLSIQVHTDLSAYSFLWRAWARIHLRRADSIRVVSEKIKKQVENFGVHAPIAVLPIFIDIRPSQILDRRSSSQKTMLWIGRFEDEKNPLQAISVLQEIRKIIPNIRLIMLGTGSLQQQVSDKAAGLPVEVSGWVQNIQPYLEVADVVLSTSRHESYGVSIIEALAAGVPVVAPDVGIAKEAGAIVAPYSELAERVIEVLERGTRGELRLQLPNEKEWAERWKETL